MNTLVLMSSKPLQKIQKLGQRYEHDERYRVIEVQETILVENYCKKYSPLVLIQFLTERAQIKDLVEICGNFYDEIERKDIIILVMSFLKNSDLNKKLLNIGVKKSLNQTQNWKNYGMKLKLITVISERRV
ncbi:MAG: hypothetical protein JNM93_09630 [Bacteriovoracaceae bacterium]|nr:hypothetical protein [Bacteriovoracaceae bacterium]